VSDDEINQSLTIHATDSTHFFRLRKASRPPQHCCHSCFPLASKPQNATGHTARFSDRQLPRRPLQNRLVSSNEATASDWEVTGDLTLNLRAERLDNNGRVYSITFECSDDSGNTSTAVTRVAVLH
jgi:hypothetical protein